MTDWGGYTLGSFAPYARKAFSDVARQASPTYVTVMTAAGPTTPNGLAKPLGGHRYGTHRWTDPYTPSIPTPALVPRPLQAADATTNPSKLDRLRGFTDAVPTVPTSLTVLLAKKSSGQY